MGSFCRSDLSAAFIPPVRTFSSNYIPHSESLMMHEDNRSRQKLNTAQLTEQITFMSDVMKLTSLRVNNERGRGELYFPCVVV